MNHEPNHDGEMNYGPRLSAEEYERRIIGLYRGLPPMPSKAQEEDIRRQELDLKIDHRLGVDFPQDRRAALWNIQRNVEKKRLWLTLKHLIKGPFNKQLTTDANALAAHLVDEYAKVLSSDEVKVYFDLQEGERPSLPIDKDYLK